MQESSSEICGSSEWTASGEEEDSWVGEGEGPPGAGVGTECGGCATPSESLRN